MSSAAVSEARTHPSVGQPAQDERPEAVRIAHADEALLVHDHQRVGALRPRQDPQQRLHEVGRRLIGQHAR